MLISSSLRLSRQTPAISRAIPIYSEKLSASPMILTDPIANTINPAAMSPGTNAGPIRLCATMKATVPNAYSSARPPSCHYRLLALDGVYALDEKGELHFLPVAPPSDKVVAKVAERIARHIEKLLIQLSMTQSGSEKDAEFGNQQPLLLRIEGLARGERSRLATAGWMPLESNTARSFSQLSAT
jgi:hypothetical protein